MGSYRAFVRQYEKTQVGKTGISKCRSVLGQDWMPVAQFTAWPPVFTVHSFYRRARLSGLWDSILEHLVKVTRQKAGLSEEPTQALIDSQSVKTTGAVEQKGFDMGKKRKE